jgi:hypothetical protein
LRPNPRGIEPGMASSNVSASINIIRGDRERPEKLLHCGRAFGLLSAIKQDDECIIAAIGKRQVVLPEEMQARLEPYLNRSIGLAQFDDEFYIREIGPEPIVEAFR